MGKVHQIYFLLRTDGMVKIGTTTNVSRRVAELERSHGSLEVIRVIHGDRRRENQIHVKCKRHNQFGEWFRDCPALRGVIASLDEGSPVEAATTSEKKAWAKFEDEVSERVHKDAKALVMLEYAANGNLINDAIVALSERYGIPYHTLHRLHYGRMQTVSAAMLEKVRTSLLDMKQRRIAALMAEIDEATADEPDFSAELGFSDQIKELKSRFEVARAASVA